MARSTAMQRRLYTRTTNNGRNYIIDKWGDHAHALARRAWEVDMLRTAGLQRVESPAPDMYKTIVMQLRVCGVKVVNIARRKGSKGIFIEDPYYELAL